VAPAEAFSRRGLLVGIGPAAAAGARIAAGLPIVGGSGLVDIVSEFGADPTGANDDTAAFAKANAQLVAAGGGLIQLRPRCTHRANIVLGPRVSLAGHGVYSQIKGVAGAGKPVVAVPDYDGNVLESLQIVGNRGGVTGPGDTAEKGLSIARGSARYPWNPVINEVNIFDTGSYGCLLANVANVYVRALRTFWTGDSGLYVTPGSVDGFYTNIDVGAILNGAHGIYAAGLQSQWTHCQSWAHGSRMVAFPGPPSYSTPRWDPDSAAVGWAIGSYQEMWNCISEDNPVGFLFLGGNSVLHGTSGGDKVPVRQQMVNPNAGGNVIDIGVRCNDRFVPTMGASLLYSYRSKVSVNVDWESESVQNTNAELGVKIKDKPGFVVFKNDSPGFGAIYNSNEYLTNGFDGWVLHTASKDGALTPDLAKGLNHYVVLDAALTINPLVHRGGVPGGTKVTFLFLPVATAASQVVTWDPSFIDASQPGIGPGRITTMEFVQENMTFTGATLRRMASSRLPATYRSVRRTSGNSVLNKPSSSTWYDLDSALDLVLNAAAGDLVLVGVNGEWGNELASAFLDVASVTPSGAPVNYWGGSGGASQNGIAGWSGMPSVFTFPGPPMPRVLVAGDVVKGQATLRLRVRLNLANTNKTLFANANQPFVFWAENRGRQDA
jgi:hypothetical protein